MKQSKYICSDEELLGGIKRGAVASMLQDYQKLLNMNDWTLELIFTQVRRVHGEVEHDGSSKVASIIVNINDELPEIQKTLLHEILHVLLKLHVNPIKNMYTYIIDYLLSDHQEQLCRRLENLAEMIKL